MREDLKKDITNSAFFKDAMHNSEVFKLCVEAAEGAMKDEYLSLIYSGDMDQINWSNDEYVSDIVGRLKTTKSEEKGGLIKGLEFVRDVWADSDNLSHIEVTGIRSNGGDVVRFDDGGVRYDAVNTLFTGEEGIEVGDKIMIATKNVDDPEYGSLKKEDFYRFRDGEYEHIYQAYFSRDKANEVGNVTEMTKAIQTRRSKECIERMKKDKTK